MDGPVIEDGEVVVVDNLIEAVRPIRTPSNERRDFGNAALLPGLINAHTHLEYTALRGFLEDVSFFPWIRTLNAVKANLKSEDWIDSAKLGALECLASGITTIADNTDSGAAFDAALWSGLRGRIYQEFFCIDHRTSIEEVVEDLVRKITRMSARTVKRLEIGISPHATYTINPAMFRAIRDDVRLRDLPLSIHIAESPAESRLIEHGDGPFADMYRRREIVWQSPGVTPTRYAADQGILKSNSLLIHCVHQNEDDIALVEQSDASIVHCPKSNAKLGAGIAPLTRWLKRRNLKIGIGTDSAVSNNSLDLFEEMRFALLLQRGEQEMVEQITALNLLTMATSGGASALGIDHLVGTLAPGKQADLIAVSFDGLHVVPASDPVKTVVYSSRASDVKLTVINGRVCYENGRFESIDASTAIAAASKIINKITTVEI